MSKNKAKIKQPITKGVAKVPVIMQLEALECGAACLTMILAYYNKWVPLEQVRADCGVSRDGSNAKNIAKAAMSYGLKVRAYSLSPESIKEKADSPCIIHWDFNHFVVLKGFKGKYVYINDPARGDVKVGIEEFDKSFTGIVICLSPDEGFEPSGKRKSTLDFARKRLIGAGAAVAFVMLTTAITSLFGIINPIMSKVFMDRLLTGQNKDWLITFIGIMTGLAAVQIVVEWIKAVYSLKLNGKMAVTGSTSYMWKVLHMPMEFFSQRMAGDIQSRQSTNASISGTLVNTFAPLLINTLMMIFYLLLMLRYSLILTLIGISTLVLNIIMSRLISEKRINITRIMQRDRAKLGATTVAGIEMIETIKASGAENGFFQKWAGYQASVNAQETKAAKMNNYLGIIPVFLAQIANYAVLIVGVWYVMNGWFTLGALQMFQGLLGSFMSPAMTLIKAGQTLQEMRTQMERVEDVMQYPVDPNSVNHNDSDENLKKLRGGVELRNITFGYSKLAAPLIKDFSLSIKPSGRVAFVGASGCGKSTVSKLISGIYEPWSGEILFDGKKRSEYDRSVMTGSVAVVDQDITLFEGTIADNIKMWDESIKDFEMILAARDAQLHEDIMARDGGYQNKLTEGGRDLSGGQRQRLEIARVLAQDPSIIILDEATSALDAKTEYEVVKSIKDRGITCIVIAHRLSSIRDCDEIIVLEHGQAVERGTHEELIKLGGAYTELVTNE
ncbi:NHLP family bacteriocin export ABC transporter peptidase/permease/ATPase subunit [Ruminococcus sp.]|uniref:NHLP family bacteriocin export ABC transporter peptidase/permease/ATPase subunit n=1 Tax=Ruminococcus sp. TaxID=41978 RepID=UPI0025FBFA7A|nr:NHLP family bacteriocin export ABC transporter peptidase/permease/ATPase subunit [Ruminococcus sp.]